MKLIMLSGNSLANKDWIYDCQKQFNGLFDECIVQDYAHWNSGANWINLDLEIEKLKDITNQLDNDYAIFAKSIGTVLATMALEEGIIKPKFLLFCGVPLNYISKEYISFNEVLANCGLPITLIHNTNDKVGSAAEVRNYMDKVFIGDEDYMFIEEPGETHDYEDYRLLKSELKELSSW